MEGSGNVPVEVVLSEQRALQVVGVGGRRRRRVWFTADSESLSRNKQTSRTSELAVMITKVEQRDFLSINTVAEHANEAAILSELQEFSVSNCVESHL